MKKKAKNRSARRQKRTEKRKKKQTDIAYYERQRDFLDL